MGKHKQKMNFHAFKSIFKTILLLLISVKSLTAQTINGKIIDKENNAVPFANVVLKSEDNQKIISFTYADKDGFFTLKTKSTGKLNLNITSLSFKPYSEPVEILNGTEEINKTILLEPESIELREVIVKTNKPITIKKDTIVINAMSFADGSESVIEDLLKKIPGLTVLNDGTIKIGDKEIEKVMIEGDDFFEKGYKIVTKNMQADAIDKIEIIQKYSENRFLKNIENSDKIALNLTLKDENKNAWFGNINMAHTIIENNFYEFKTNVMKFDKKTKLYFLANLNNNGIDATGDLNSLINSNNYANDSNLGINLNSKIISLFNTVPNLNENRTKFNNEKLLSANAIVNINEYLKLKLIGLFDTDGINFEKNVFKKFDFEGTSFENMEENTYQRDNVLGYGKLNLIYDNKKNQLFDYQLKWSQSDETINNNLVFNSIPIGELLKNEIKLFDQKLNYTYKISENDVFLITGRYATFEQPQNYTINNVIFDAIIDESIPIETANQVSKSEVTFFGIETNYLKKYNKSLFEIILGNTFRTNELKSTALFTTDTNFELMPDDYQNMFTYKQSNLYLKLKYQLEWRKFSVKTKIEGNKLSNELNQENNNTSENPLLLNSEAELIWDFKPNHSLSAIASNYYTNLSLRDIIPNYYLTGFNTFSKGTNSFDQLGTTNLRFNYKLDNWKKSFFINTSFFYIKNHDWLSTNSIVEQNYIIENKIIIDNSESFSGSFVFDKFFKSISSNLKFNLGYSESKFTNIVNQSDFRLINAKIYRTGLELKSGFKGVLNYHFGSSWIHNSVETTTKNSFTNNFTFFDVSFVFNDKFTFVLQSEQYYFGNQSTTNKYYRFLDSEFRYNVIQNKLSIALSGYNLLNTDTFSNLWVSDINQIETQYRILPTRLMLKATFRF